MAILKFADTHNMVAFLSKPIESDGFEQIVDFLNAHPIRYALTIYPTIYISCIEQFWSTFIAKTINGEEQLHALLDGKKIIITESSIRRDLQLADEEGVDCLPNSTIFEQLTLMRCLDEAVHKELGDSLVVVPGAKKPWGILLLKLEYKSTQHNEIASLKRRVKKLENKNRSRTHRLKRLYKVGFTARVESSDNEESLGEDASKQGRIDAIDAYEEITLVSVHDVNVSASEEVFATTVDDITLAQEKIDADHQLAERMHAQEQEELSIEENATLFQQLLEKKRKHFVVKRAEEKRNKPPIKVNRGRGWREVGDRGQGRGKEEEEGRR
ncbi:hypothetical protein Tco_0498818 [Tanacetum coccineum]